MAHAKFWQNGIQFECQGTGKCCMARGKYGYVYLTKQDRKRLAQFLNLPEAEFLNKHCTRKNGHWHLKNPDQNCAFLEGKQCTVYEGRPIQCRTWPFWPENMNAKTWNEEVLPFCAGINQGKTYSAAEIKEILLTQKTDD